MKDKKEFKTVFFIEEPNETNETLKNEEINAYFEQLVRLQELEERIKLVEKKINKLIKKNKRLRKKL